MKTSQKIYTGLGCLKKLRNILSEYDVSKIMIVSGKGSFEKSGAKGSIIPILEDYECSFFSDFDPNPKLSDAVKGAHLLKEFNAELIISIGGGSVLDMSKLMKALYTKINSAEDIVKNQIEIHGSKIPIIAIPTTAGSGSESTHFAVVYINNMKFSVADFSLMPNEVLLDGMLTISGSRYLKACNVLDAISQSIESAWAVGATEESQKLSYSALSKSIDAYKDFVNLDNPEHASQRMIEASNIAGKAINISKTTSAHAWSYGVSSYHDIAHGHAVWTTLPKIFELHNSSSELQMNDPRGQKHLKETMGKLKDILSMSENDNPLDFFKKLLEDIDIYADLKDDMNISKSERERLSKAVNIERMANNPIMFSNNQIKYIFNL